LNETINEVVTLEKDLDSFAEVFPKPSPMVGKTTFNNNNDIKNYPLHAILCLMP